jgi:serine/threonine protein kinase
MPGDNWNRIEEIFLEAADLPAPERAAFLERTCHGDAGLRAEVESLLRADDTGPAMVEAAIESEAASMLQESSFAGARLGAYRVVHEIGRGGMGSVYLAERDDDQFHKLVAIKVVKRGMDTEEVLGRFRHERQILAGLEHAYIARLIDGGTTPDGRPFFVMEKVEGQPVDVYCREHNLNLKSRLRLFVRICEAVSYAHSNLVVHRDLKPGNILVTAEGVPKLLDFGVAKLLDPDADSGLTSTVYGAGPLTPEYASPEQVRGLPVTTSTDVYALGAILYELLTGTRAQKIDTHTPAEIDRVVCETQPLRPSAASLALRLDDDLDNIVWMAMQKERERRYQSVDQFAEDIRRYLEARPVLARRDSLWYRSLKFARRRRYALVAAAAILASLVGGIVIAYSQARDAKAARQAAELNRDAAISERQRAEERLAQIVTLSNRSLSDVYGLMERLPGAMPARKELLSAMLDFLEKLSKEAGNDDRLKLALAKAYLRLGNLQGDPDSPNIGDTAGALKSFQTASALLAPIPLAAQSSDATERIAVWADLQNQMGKVYTAMGDHSNIKETLEGAIRVVETSAVAAHGTPLRIRAALYLTLSRATFELPQALQYANTALKEAGAVARQFPQDSGVQLLLSGTHTQVGYVHRLMGEPEAAVERYEESMRIRERLVRDHPNDILFRRYLKLAYEHLASIQNRLGHPEIARLYYRKAQPLEEADLADPQNQSAKFDYANYLFVAATVDVPAKDLPESLATLRKAASIFESLAAAEPGIERHDRALAVTCQYMGHRLLAMGKYAEALVQYRRAVELDAKVLSRDPRNQGLNDEALAAERGFTRALMFAGDRNGALKHANGLIQRAEALRGASSSASVGEAYLTLAAVHRQFGDCDQAVQAAERSIHHLRPLITAGRHDANHKVLDDAEALLAECSSRTSPAAPARHHPF